MRTGSGTGAYRATARDRGPYAQSVLNSLRRTVRAFRTAAQAAEQDLGVTGAQHFVLEKLADAPAASLNELAARTMTHKSSVSVAVSRLVTLGLVRRRPSPTDGRSIVLTLTAAGQRVLHRAPESAQSRLQSALRRFPADQLIRFAGLFERLTEELGAGDVAPLMMFEEPLGPQGRGHSRRRRGTRAANSTS